jgi:hypothetical protein
MCVCVCVCVCVREREREMALPNRTSLSPGSRVTNPKSGPDYSVFMMNNIFFSNFTYPVRCFRVSLKMSSSTPGVRVTQVEDHVDDWVST